MRSYKHRDHDIVIHLADDHNVMLGDEYTEITPGNDGAGGVVREAEEEEDSPTPLAAAHRRGRGRPRKSVK